MRISPPFLSYAIPRLMHDVAKILVVGLGNVSHPGTRHRSAAVPHKTNQIVHCPRSVGHTIIDSLANSLHVHLIYDRALMGWVGQTRATLHIPRPAKGSRKASSLSQDQLEVDVILLKPSA